ELLPQYLADEAIRRRFVNDARIMRQLSHPNIVTVYDFYEPEDIPGLDAYYIIMEYMDGGSLENALRQGLTIERAITVTVAVCAALGRAHRDGVIHRDVKPANVLMSKDGQIIKLGDFGIAHLPDLKQTTGGHPGTLIYMSPEQTRGGLLAGKLDGRSDLYAVGAMLYEMLTGRSYLDFPAYIQQADKEFRRQKGLPRGAELSPFLKLEQEMAIQRAIAQVIANVQPEDPRRFNPDIPPALAAVVLKALAKNPADRYQDAEAMIAALREVETETLPTTTTQARSLLEKRLNDLFARSQAATQRGEFATALELMGQALEIAPDSPRVHGELASIQMKRGDYRTAIQHWKEVIALDQAYPKAYLELARCYNQLQLFDRAIQIQEQGLRVAANRGDPTFYHSLAIAYWKAGRCEEAIWALEKACQIDDDPKKRALLQLWQRRIGSKGVP
ncbi:MAG TPA: serine/threonine-protein kinase, partial [Anaerolineae bacterium]|nr:serine/threonine-protein kinase [Anaerolineae bacterium]